jgi:hypothetical protein
MAKIISAKAVLSAEDRGASAVFDKLAKKIDQVGKAGKAAAAVDQMAKSIERAKTQMAAIDKFNSSRGGFADARARFQATQAAVTQAAAAMKRGEGDARQLALAYERAQGAVSRAARAFEQQKTAVLSAKRALDGFGIPIAKLATEQNRLRSAVDAANAALDRQHARAARVAKVTGAIGHVAGTVGMIAGPGILHATKEGVKAGAEIQHEVVKMRAAGIPEQDINQALDQTARFQSKYTNVQRSTALERFKELRSVLMHPEEAHELLETTVRANSAMNAVDRSGHLSEGLGFGIKGAEILGRAQDPKRFAAYIDAFIKAQQVMGKTITPEQQFEMAKYFGASGATLSDRFVNTTGISLVQEMQSRAAVGTDQLIKQVVGGFQGSQHSAAKEFVKLGLADKDDFEKTKTGEIKGLKPGHHVKNWRKAMTDPDKYVYEDVLPALEKAGITKQEDQIAYGRRLFTSGRAADVFAKLVQQRQSFDNHAKLYEKAQGIDAGDTNAKDPFVALNSLSTSLKNFAGTMTSPVMENAATTLSGMAGSIGAWAQSLAEFQKNNPTLAKAAGAGAIVTGAGVGGAATYGLISSLMNGFGLKASAVALDGSAAALTAAAARLGGGSLPSLPGGKGAPPAPKGPSILKKALWAGGILGVPTLVGVGAYYAAESANEAQGITRDSERARRSKQAAKYNWWGKYDPAGADERAKIVTAEKPNPSFIAPELTPSMAFDLPASSGFPDVKALRKSKAHRKSPMLDRLSTAFASPELSPSMTYGTGLGRDAGPVTATLVGSAEVSGEAEVKVVVEAGSSLLQVVEQARRINMDLRGSVNANGPGSAGKSSPDASAPATGASGAW